jgi:hypothetical protein
MVALFLIGRSLAISRYIERRVSNRMKFRRRGSFAQFYRCNSASLGLVEGTGGVVASTQSHFSFSASLGSKSEPFLPGACKGQRNFLVDYVLLSRIVRTNPLGVARVSGKTDAPQMEAR